MFLPVLSHYRLLQCEQDSGGFLLLLISSRASWTEVWPIFRLRMTDWYIYTFTVHLQCHYNAVATMRAHKQSRRQLPRSTWGARYVCLIFVTETKHVVFYDLKTVSVYRNISIHCSHGVTCTAMWKTGQGFFLSSCSRYWIHSEREAVLGPTADNRGRINTRNTVWLSETLLNCTGIKAKTPWSYFSHLWTQLFFL